MDEKILLKIALGTAIVGLIVLFILSRRIVVDEAMLNRLDGLVDESVVVSGVVVDVSRMNSTTFVRIEKNELTSVVLFGKAPMLDVGDLIQVRGTVATHDNKTEIIGEEVRVI